MSEKKHYFDSKNTQPKLSYKYLENLKRESRYETLSFVLTPQGKKKRREGHSNRLLKMTAEMTAGYIMIIWLVEMTAEMTAGSIELIR